MPVKRIACVYLAHLPVQVERTLDGRLLGAPFIVSGLAWKPESVLDVSPEAVGVHLAMNVRQAKQACPHAQVLPPREELYYSIHNTLTQICEQFSPQVETAGLGLFFIDVSDMERLYGDEHQLSLALLQSIRYSSNLTARVGIAGNKFTAEQAARRCRDGHATLVPPKQERMFLMPLPITALPEGTDKELLRRLDLFGIHILGQFADLAPAAIARQFGAGALGVHNLARGIDPRPINPAAPPPAVTHVANFTYHPLRDRMVLARNVEKVAGLVAQSLDVAGYHAEGLRVVVTFNNDAEAQRATTVRPPTADTQPIIRAALRIASMIETPQPVTSLRITAYPLRPWYADAQQLSFVDQPPDTVRQLQLTLATLWSRFGEMIIRVASLVGSPVPIEVKVQPDPRGRPMTFQWGGYARIVKHIRDHWRTTSRWWQKPIHREHYLVETMHGNTYSVFAEDQRWYIDRKHPR